MKVIYFIVLLRNEVNVICYADLFCHKDIFSGLEKYFKKKLTPKNARFSNRDSFCTHCFCYLKILNYFYDINFTVKSLHNKILNK